MPEMAQFFATLGVGGALAGMMFYFYRQDVQRLTEQWKGQSEMLALLVKENTSANTTLTETIRALHAQIAYPGGRRATDLPIVRPPKER